MRPNNNKILIVLPAYNETGKVGRVVEKIIATGFDSTILVVDDCSSDDTSGEAQKAGATVYTVVMKKQPKKGLSSLFDKLG